MNNIYNEETKQSKLINDLKNLPQIKAPENFEFNLMTRIQNKNFESELEERQKFNLMKFFAPSAAVVAVVLLFFVFYPQRQEIQNQISNQPKLADTQKIVEQSISHENSSKQNIAAKDNIVNRNTQQIQTSNPKKLQGLFNSQKSVSVDDYISGNSEDRTQMQRGNIVNSGSEPIVDGFYLEKQVDKKTIEKYRTALDSLKRAQLKADSLKKAQK